MYVCACEVLKRVTLLLQTYHVQRTTQGRECMYVVCMYSTCYVWSIIVNTIVLLYACKRTYDVILHEFQSSESEDIVFVSLLHETADEGDGGVLFGLEQIRIRANTYIHSSIFKYTYIFIISCSDDVPTIIRAL